MVRTLFIGDVHGCSAELKELLELAQPTRILLTGDLFTRGPDPRGCWELIRAHGALAVLGNHDARMLQVWDRAARGEGRSEAHACVRRLQAHSELRAWLQQRPLILQEPGWVLVHAGVHPELGVPATKRRHALLLRRWPDDEDSSNPHWWASWAQHRLGLDRPLVIYGHDAVRGAQDHRPFTLGLDSGCVYGGALTGYLLEEDRLLRVPARRVWSAPGR